MSVSFCSLNVLSIMSTDSDGEMPVPRRKKGVRNLNCRDKIKMAKWYGLEHTNQNGVVVSAKTTGTDCRCRNMCTTTFTEEEKEHIIRTLYDGRPKNDKDAYLIGLIERHDIRRRRPVKEDSMRNKSSSFTYFAMKGTERVKVCRKAFLSLHSVSNKAVFRLCTLIQTLKSPEDMRGKHNNRGNLIDSDLVICIDQHIKSFPTEEAHYKDDPIIYLDAKLTVKKMHELFLAKYPEHVRKIKYDYYLKHFNENYGYSFGRPEADVYSTTCEELDMEVKWSSLNQNAEEAAFPELIVHEK